MGIFVTVITVAFFAQWKCGLISMQWYTCSLMDWNAGECLSLTLVRGLQVSERHSPAFHSITIFPLFLRLPLSFNSNYDGTIVLKILLLLVSVYLPYVIVGSIVILR